MFWHVKSSYFIEEIAIYGIQGIPLALFDSYLSERFQAVKINNTISDYKLITHGVPQGSVLGPILYLIYVNELPNISNIFSTCVFADDTTLIFENSNKYDRATATACRRPKTEKIRLGTYYMTTH